VTNLKDILSTVGAIVTLLIGTYTSYVDSLPAGASFNWKSFLVYLVIAIGLYLNGKNANGTTKTVAQLVSQADPGKPTISPAFPVAAAKTPAIPPAAKVLVLILLLPALMGLSGCGVAAPVIISDVCTVASEICNVQSMLCTLTPKIANARTAADSTALAAQQKYWTDSLNVLAKQLQIATK